MKIGSILHKKRKNRQKIVSRLTMRAFYGMITT